VCKICNLSLEADGHIANIYSNGVSEEIIGKALKKYSIPRHKVVILSKCFAYIGEEAWMQNAPEVSPLRIRSIKRNPE
jgi:aryl-alcohol dehydrogenase-like predicted oxidoreductase